MHLLTAKFKRAFHLLNLKNQSVIVIANAKLNFHSNLAKNEAGFSFEKFFSRFCSLESQNGYSGLFYSSVESS